MASYLPERSPLLGSRAPPPQDSYAQQSEDEYKAHRVRRIVVGGVLTFLFVAAVVISLLFVNQQGWPWEDDDPLTKARAMLTKAPVIVSSFSLQAIISILKLSDTFIGWTHWFARYPLFSYQF